MRIPVKLELDIKCCREYPRGYEVVGLASGEALLRIKTLAVCFYEEVLASCTKGDALHVKLLGNALRKLVREGNVLQSKVVRRAKPHGRRGAVVVVVQIGVDNGDSVRINSVCRILCHSGRSLFPGLKNVYVL